MTENVQKVKVRDNTGLGPFLKAIRKNKGISRRELYYGLCNSSTGSRIELGEQIPDRLLFQVLLQRLGIAPEKFLADITYPEYIYFTWKEKILEALKLGLTERAKELLCGGKRIHKSINKKLQHQFLYYVKSYIEINTYKRIELLLKAIRISVPDFLEGTWTSRILSSYEINIILCYMDFVHSTGLQADCIWLLEKVLSYIENKIVDKQEKAKVISYVTILYVKFSLLGEENRLQRIMRLESAIEFLSAAGIIHGMLQLLEFILKDLANVDIKKYEGMVPYRDALKNLYREYGENWNLDVYLESIGEVFLVHEILYAHRSSAGISQEIVSDGICAIETYSRIERGKQHLSKRRYEKFKDYYKIRQNHYFCDVYLSDHFEILEKKWELEQASNRGDLEKMSELFLYIKEYVNLAIIENLQYIEGVENALNFRKNKITAEEFLTNNKKTISRTVTKEVEQLDMDVLTKTEVILFVHRSIVYRKMGKPQIAINILNSLLRCLDKSMVERKHRREEYALIYENLSDYLYECGNFELALAYIEKRVKLELACNRGSGLGRCIHKKAKILEKLYGKTKDTDKYNLLSKWLCELFSGPSNISCSTNTADGPNDCDKDESCWHI